MLTSKQRSYLRGLANNIPAIFQVGKGGIDDNTIKQFDEALEARELVKASVLKIHYICREAAEEIAQALGADVVAVIGRKFVLYKESGTIKLLIFPNKIFIRVSKFYINIKICACNSRLQVFIISNLI